jgi:hypothetical protein
MGGFIITLFGLLSVMDVFTGGFSTSILVYYTIQSNFLALILFALLIFRTLKNIRTEGEHGKTGYYPRLEMVCVIDLLLTFIVYWILLAPGFFTMSGPYSPFSFGSLATHLFTPLLCLLDYILFTDSGHLRYRDVYFVLIYPLAYLALTSTAGLLGYVYRIDPDGKPVRFPYFFYDFDRIGAQSLLYIGAMILFFLLLSHGLYLFDKKVRKPVLLPRQKQELDPPLFPISFPTSKRDPHRVLLSLAGILQRQSRLGCG